MSLTIGECAQSALKDLVCILKQMGLHSEATTTIVQYRAMWPEVRQCRLNSFDP